MVRPKMALAWLLAAAALSMVSETASAQIRNRPTVSPYLNLLQFDAGLSGQPNYQTMVRPQLQQRRLNRQTNQQLRYLQNDVGALQSAVSAGAGPQAAIRPTGRAGTDLGAYYGNLDHYYGGSRLHSAIR